ncbi:hypothetical protein [Gorillibacterium sp. CAU 1737]|uniref:hypothetical protein n=1 Tax=Gorillibacterium sp. CAU 1737 TaxID=3140362 RepID=UPI003261025B
MPDFRYSPPPGPPDDFHPPYPPYSPYPKPPRKRVGLAVFFSLLIPGLGHLYLGLMRRGVSYLIGLVLNIVLISIAVSLGNEFILSTSLTLFLSLGIPLLYLYCLFDAMHRARLVNRLMEDGISLHEADELPFRPAVLGGVLIIAGCLVLMSETAPAFMNSLLRAYGGTVMALLMVGGGGWMLFRMK